MKNSIIPESNRQWNFQIEQLKKKRGEKKAEMNEERNDEIQFKKKTIIGKDILGKTSSTLWNYR